MKITDSPIKEQEPNTGEWLWYVWGEVWSRTHDFVRGDTISADPRFSGAAPLKPHPNRFACGRQWTLADVRVAVSYLPWPYQDGSGLGSDRPRTLAVGGRSRSRDMSRRRATAPGVAGVCDQAAALT